MKLNYTWARWRSDGYLEFHRLHCTALPIAIHTGVHAISTCEGEWRKLQASHLRGSIKQIGHTGSKTIPQQYGCQVALPGRGSDVSRLAVGPTRVTKGYISGDKVAGSWSWLLTYRLLHGPMLKYRDNCNFLTDGSCWQKHFQLQLQPLARSSKQDCEVHFLVV